MNYVIKSGDSLYAIAKKYNTTVDNLMKTNHNLNPYDLKVGTFIKIPITNNIHYRDNVKEKMRNVWEQHVFWTRLLIISIIERLNDEPETANRLLRNATDLANIYRPYYGEKIANTIDKLITDRLVIGSKLIHALADNDIREANKLDIEWYKNADAIANALSSINPYYNEEELRRMLYEHLDLTKDEVTNRLNRNYKKEIEVFDNVEKEAIMMSDYLSNGINRQFHKH